MTQTSGGLAAFGSHYVLTRSIALSLAAMFMVMFPKLYKEYQEAFDAGVWISDDPGPFLGRAIVYKLQGKLHKDRHDYGPSASFPVGLFTGGEMKFPQLQTKLL